MTKQRLTQLGLGLSLGLLGNALHAAAPDGSINFYGVLKRVDYEQSSAIAPTSPTSDGYVFEALVEAPAEPTDTITGTPTLTVAVGTAGSVSLSFDVYGGEWIVESNKSSQAALDNEYGNGDYTFGLGFSGAGSDSEVLTLVADTSGTFFTEIPTVTSLTNAAWLGGAVTIDPAGGLATVGFNGDSITGFGGAGPDLVAVNIEGDNIESTSGFESFTVGSGGDFNLSAGSYEVELEFINVVDEEVGFGDAEGLAGFSSITSFDLVVVPEPSHYALLSGLLACGCMLLRRRAKQ